MISCLEATRYRCFTQLGVDVGDFRVLVGANGSGKITLRQLLQQNDWWPQGDVKPPRPKKAAEWVLRQTRLPRSSSIHQQMAAKVSIRGCTDPAFRAMREQLHAWFPGGGEE